jgi:hypothetical protein
MRCTGRNVDAEDWRCTNILFFECLVRCVIQERYMQIQCTGRWSASDSQGVLLLVVIVGHCRKRSFGVWCW